MNVINRRRFIGKLYFRFEGNCDSISPAGALGDFASFTRGFITVKSMSPPSFYKNRPVRGGFLFVFKIKNCVLSEKLNLHRFSA